MRRALLALALTVLILPGPAAASTQSATKTDTACLGLDPAPIALIGCAIGTVDETLDCSPTDATHVQCWGNLTWTATGGNPGGFGPAGNMVRAGGATMAWNNFQYGLGLRITNCNFGASNPTCTDKLSYSMWSGPIPVAAGACLTVSLSGWIYVTVYQQPAPLWNKLSPDGSTATASIPSLDLSDTVCP